MTEIISSPVISPLRILACTSRSSTTFSALAKTELPKVAFGELLLDPSARPKGEFHLLIWESRLPPYTSTIHFVPNCTQDMPQEHSLSGRKRHTVPFSDSMNYIQCNYKLRMHYFHMCSDLFNSDFIADYWLNMMILTPPQPLQNIYHVHEVVIPFPPDRSAK